MAGTGKVLRVENEVVSLERRDGKQFAINFEPRGANKEGIYWVRIRGAGVREQYLVELY